MHKDDDGNIIGVGEDTVYEIAKRLFSDPYEVKRQVPIHILLQYNQDEFRALSLEYKKHKADIVIYNRWYFNYEGVIRVQGHDHTSGKKGISHEQKSLKDKNLKKIFENSEMWVCDILFVECPNIFKERLNWDSIFEFCNMMKMIKKPGSELGN